MINSNGGEQTISSRVYYGLRGHIISLELKPGEEINIKTIAENLGVSKSPVRDALLKLAKEGLVDVVPQKGTFVSKIDLVRTHEERFLRQCLEEKTLELFIAEHTEADLFYVNQSLELQRESLKRKDYLAFLDHDDAFHGIFFKSTGKNMCWDIIQSMSGHYRRIRLITLWDESVVKNVIAQHEELADCIRRRDVEAALRISKIHLSKIIFEEQDLVKKYPGYFTTPSNKGLLTGKFI